MKPKTDNYESDFMQTMIDSYYYGTESTPYDINNYLINGTFKGSADHINSLVIIGDIDSNANISDVKNFVKINPNSGERVLVKALSREAQREWQITDGMLTGEVKAKHPTNHAMILLRTFCIALKYMEHLNSDDFIKACKLIIECVKKIKDVHEYKVL